MAKSDIEKIDKNFKLTTVENPKDFKWVDAHDKKLQVKGLPWFHKNKGSFCRFPLKAKKIVREPVWLSCQQTASAYIQFKTDATSMAVKAMTEGIPRMNHMPASGSNGLFLYGGEPDNMRPWASAIPVVDENRYDRYLFQNIPKKMREFKLYLPLYAKLESLQIGFNKGAKILKPSAERLKKPIVFYGTSITQGGCANNPGSDFVSIVGRNLNIETINIGFSGNGRGEPEVAELVSEIDASMYVLDYVRNVKEDGLKKTLPNFIKILRKKHSKTPIMLVSACCFTKHNFLKTEQNFNDNCREIMMENYLKERKKGDKNIHFVDGYNLISFAEDGAYVDGIHPTTHGFFLMADRLRPFIEMILLRDN